ACRRFGRRLSALGQQRHPGKERPGSLLQLADFACGVAQTAQKARMFRWTGLPLMLGTDAVAPSAPTPNAGAAQVLGRAPRPRTFALRPCIDQHTTLRLPRISPSGVSLR